MNAATKLTRKQRNRIAADRSRRKRQEEHNRLKERVRELEIVNELLKRENELLVMGTRAGAGASGLLSPADLIVLRRLTAPCQASKAQPLSTYPPSVPAGQEGQRINIDDGAASPCGVESNGDGATTVEVSTMDAAPSPETAISETAISEEPIDSATTSPTNVTPVATPSGTDVTAVEALETGGNFKPAALELSKPLQKEPRSSLVSLRRNILAAMVTPKIMVSLRPTDAHLTQERIIQVLLGSKNISTKRVVKTPLSGRSAGSSENRLVKAMFSMTKVSH